MIFFYILCILVGIIIILAIVVPKKFSVNRSIVINKPLPEVFQYLIHIKNQNNWSPWKLKDPHMKQEYIGTDGTVGFISKWEGNKDVGTGEQEIIRITENESIEAQLRFFKPWKSQSDAKTTVEDLGDGQTKVVWGFSGKSKPPTNVFFLFFNMDKTVGKDFEEGLALLKKYWKINYSSMETNLISWIEIPVLDMTRAKVFYEVVFNIEIKIQDFEGIHMGWFPMDDKKPGASGALILNEAYIPSETQGVLIYFNSNNIKKQLELVEKSGGKITQNFTEISPEIGAMGLFIDTEGNRIALYSNP